MKQCENNIVTSSKFKLRTVENWTLMGNISDFCLEFLHYREFIYLLVFHPFLESSQLLFLCTILVINFWPIGGNLRLSRGDHKILFSPVLPSSGIKISWIPPGYKTRLLKMLSEIRLPPTNTYRRICTQEHMYAQAHVCTQHALFQGLAVG